MQHQWSRDNPFIPVRIEEEEGYIGKKWNKMENTAYKGENMIFWRYLAPRLAEEHALPPHEQIDKDTPRRRSERSEGRGGTGAQPSEKSLSQTLHPGNSKQVHKTTTLPPQQQQTTTNPFTQITIRGDNERHPKKWNQCQRALASCSEWDNLSTPAANDKHM